MDTEDGVEVVWNEVLFSERKSFRNQEVSLNSFKKSSLNGMIVKMRCFKLK